MFVTLIISCNKDDAEITITQSGTFTIEGVEYPVIHGEILRFESMHGVYACPLYFLSDDFELLDEDIAGIGQVAEVGVWSNTDVHIESGIYAYFDENAPQSTTFTASFFLNFNSESWDMDYLFQGKEGTLEVTRNGDAYELFFDVLTDKYEIEHMEPDDDPIDTDIRITLSYKDALKQKYFE